MRGTGSTISSFPPLRALVVRARWAGIAFAGATLLAGALSSRAVAQADETAFALPRLAPRGGEELALPQPLEPASAARLRRAFALQVKGEGAAAARLAAELAQPGTVEAGLYGHLLAERYLGPAYHSSPADLTAWLARFPDLPDAPAIYALLRRRLPPGVAVPPPPPVPAPIGQQADEPLAAIDEAVVPPLPRNPTLDQTMRDFAREGSVARALRLLTRTPGLTAAYGAVLRAELARALFAANRDGEALDLAGIAWRQSGGASGLAAYVAGLASWRLGRVGEARRWFEQAAGAADGLPALKAAAALWAARAHLGHDRAASHVWLEQAAAFPRSFHGQIAARMLGRGETDAAGPGMLGEADIAAVGATAEGRRAFALLQIGQTARAAAELRALVLRSLDEPVFAGAVLRVANRARLFGVAAQFGGLVPSAARLDQGALPVPLLRPRNGFRIDPALVYALARLESNFDAAAVSPAGARGLMQIMPVTAGYLAGQAEGQVEHVAAWKERLRDPGLNLDLGQRYLLYLAEHGAVAGDMLRLLASYNAGPGNVARWSATIRDEGDPLLFIEAIPSEVTRLYVQRALTYTWLYAARLHLPAPSLDDLAAGRFPVFLAAGRMPFGVAAEAATRIH